MNLYQALQGVLDKVKQNNENVMYSSDEKELLRAMMDSQERLAESIMILGGLMQGILADNVEIEVIPPKTTLRN